MAKVQAVHTATTQEIAKAVSTLKSLQEVQAVFDAANAQFKRIQANMATQFQIGDVVSFDGGRRHGRKSGTITAIGSTSCDVMVPSLHLDGKPVNWKVAASLLHKVS